MQLASSFDVVILFCGNNDLSQDPWKPALTAQKRKDVVSSFQRFENALVKQEPGVVLVIIGLLPRPDVELPLVQKTNQLIHKTLPECYASPRDIRDSGHFGNDSVHLNTDGA